MMGGMKLSIIVAMSENRVIGRDGDLPWHLSADLKRFKRLTMGHPILMGRKTYESIGRPLPGRRSIVISRQADYRPEGVDVAGSLPTAIELCGDVDEAFIIGGASIYEQALPLANRLHLTQVLATVEGDTFFPEIAPERLTLVESEETTIDEKSGLSYQFLVYDLKS